MNNGDPTPVEGKIGGIRTLNLLIQDDKCRPRAFTGQEKFARQVQIRVDIAVHGLKLERIDADAGFGRIFVGSGHSKRQSRNACAHPVASHRERH